MCFHLLAIGLQGTLTQFEPLLNTFSTASTVRPTLQKVFSRGYAPTTPRARSPSAGVTGSRFFALLRTIATRPMFVCCVCMLFRWDVCFVLGTRGNANILCKNDWTTNEICFNSRLNLIESTSTLACCFSKTRFESSLHVSVIFVI